MRSLLKNAKILFDPREIRKIFLLLIGMIIMAVLEVVGIASVIPFISIVSDPKVIHSNEYLSFFYQYFSFSQDYKFLIATGVFLFTILILSNAFKLFMSWNLISFTTNSTHVISARLLKLYLTQPYEFFLIRNTSDLSKNILSEVDRAIAGVVMPIMESISKIFIITFILLGLIIVDPVLAITTSLILGIVYLFIYVIVRNRLYRIGNSSTIAISECFKATNEAMLGIKELKLYGVDDKFYKKFFIPSAKQAKYKAKSSIISIFPSFALETIAFGGIVLIIIFMIGKNQTVGQVIPLLSLYALAGYRLLPALQALYRGLTNSRFNLPAFNILINDIVIASNEDYDRYIVDDTTPFKDNLRFNNVTYTYPESKTNVITNINFSIQSNTTVGFVGSSGAGKTTIIDILMGLLIPSDGQIEVDGSKLTSDNINNWQRNIGYVPQEIHLMDASIEENIAFSNDEFEIDRQQVIKVSKIADLHSFIEDLPNQYETNIGERGVKLSGGQRQRIGIARALYRDPSILVLDEATSSLDTITEQSVLNAINKLNHQKTIVIIAHRLSSLKCCDIIYMIDQGIVADKGNYDSLISQNNKFRKMAKSFRN
jgi:ATP-binding cassette, subfamily B, bacterial PglK